MTQQKSKSLAVVAFAAAAVMTIGSSHAALILVDLNGQGTDPGATWNTIAAPTDTADLIDATTLLDSGINLSFVNESTVDPSNEDNAFRDSGSTVTTGAWSTTAFSAAAEDYFWGNNAATGTIVLSNVADGSYKIELVSSTDNGDFRMADITVNGAFADSAHNGNDFDSHRDGHDNGSLLVWSNVEITGGSGVITIQSAIEAQSADHPYSDTYDAVHDYTYSDDGNQNKTTHINAFSVTSIPEPTSMSLLAIGGLGLLLKRRRRGA